MKYKELEQYLFNISDVKFASFSSSLSNSDYISIGVKNPELRKIIKEHKNDKELDTKDFVLGKYLEIDFIYYGLSLIRLDNARSQLDFLKREIRNAKSWAITDVIPTFMKKLSFDDFQNFFFDSYNKEYTYQRRMAYVLGLKFYKDKNILFILDYIGLNEEYMVMMAEAWLLSYIAISFEDEIYNYLEKCDDITLKRKTISKICDSYRYSTESKDRFKQLR